MLIYKQKEKKTKLFGQVYSEVLQVNDIGWLQYQRQSFETRGQGKNDLSYNSHYLKYLISFYSAAVSKDNINKYRLPTKSDIEKLNIWLKEEGNLKKYKDFYHIIKDNDEIDKFWVDYNNHMLEVGNLRNGQIEIDLATDLTSFFDEEHNILVCKQPLALSHLVVPISECEEIPD